MPDHELLGWLWPFALASLLIEITPGPNMTYLALVSASEGRPAGLATMAGVALGLLVLGLIAAAGVAELVAASPLLYEALRWGGVLFLLYLAWDGWRNGADIAALPENEAGRHFARGLVTNLLNPKAALFYVTVLPGFLPPGAGAGASAAFAVLYVAIATLVHLAIVLAAARFNRFVHGRSERVTRRVLSVLLAGVAVWLAISTAR